MVPYRKHPSSLSTGEPTSTTYIGTSPSRKSLRNNVKFDTVVVNQEKGLNRQKSLLLIVVESDTRKEKFMNIFLCITFSFLIVSILTAVYLLSFYIWMS